MARVRHLGHRRREDMLSHEALAISRNAEPASSSRSGIRHFEGPEYGALAEV
jgi:hypothetical protein